MSKQREEELKENPSLLPDSAAGEQKAASVVDADLVAGESKRDADWIAEVSHELRLPIANLKLLIETLLDGALEDEEAARRMLNRAQTEVDRLQRLVVDLLSVEQTSSHREVSKYWVPLETRAQYAIETTKKQADEKKDPCGYAN